MKIELTKDEIQTTANALYELVEEKYTDSTRDKELKEKENSVRITREDLREANEAEKTKNQEYNLYNLSL